MGQKRIVLKVDNKRLGPTPQPNILRIPSFQFSQSVALVF
jgi:hypothetical protein